MKRALRWAGGPVDVACLGTGTLAVANDRVLDVYSLDGTDTTHRFRSELPFSCRNLRCGWSEHWLVATDAERHRGCIIDLTGNAAPVDLAGTDAFGGTLARIAGGEVALVVRDRGRLEVVPIDPGQPSFVIDLTGFLLEDLVSIGGAERTIAVGRWKGDYRIVLGVLDVTRTQGDDIEQLQSSTGIMDESARLCVGPCGSDAFVAFRDPDGDEDPDEPPEDDDCRREFWGLCGAYVRRLDGTVVQQIELDHFWDARSAAAGGTRTLAVAGKDIIHLIDRSTEVVAQVVGRWLAASPDGARVLVEQDGELGILEL